MEVKYLQVRKENIFTKFINFFRKMLYKQPTNIEQPDITNEDINKKTDFLNSIKIEQDDPYIIDLQNKFENKEIELSSLSDEEVHNLNLLYKKQIHDLKRKLEEKKTEINIIENRIKIYSANA